MFKFNIDFEIGDLMLLLWIIYFTTFK